MGLSNSSRGLDNAGKSTIVKSILGQDIDKVTPTMGFEINTVEFKGYQLNIWDIGGQQTLRSFWFNYFDKLDSLIWVIDLGNLQRLNENFQEFYKILSNEKLIGLKILILLNKVDLIEDLDEIPIIKQKIVGSLQLDTIDQTKWNIVECSAFDVQTISNGLDWLIG